MFTHRLHGDCEAQARRQQDDQVPAEHQLHGVRGRPERVPAAEAGGGQAGAEGRHAARAHAVQHVQLPESREEHEGFEFFLNTKHCFFAGFLYSQIKF